MKEWGVVAKVAEREISSSYKEKILCNKGGETLNKVAWRCCGISFLADIQNWTNQGSDLTPNLLDQVTFRNPFQSTLSFNSKENNLFSSKTPSLDWGNVLIENNDIKEVQLGIRNTHFKIMEVIVSES